MITVKNLLIIEMDKYNWYKVFEGFTAPGGDELRVEQTEWEKLSLTSYSDTGVVCRIYPAENPQEDTPMNKKRTIQPDFVLIRNMVRGISPGTDSRNLLYGLMYINIPSVNTLGSIYMCLERPVVYGALLGIEERLGHNRFPLIPQTYYPNHNEMIITPQYPIVVKVGAAHAGMGKMRFRKHDDFLDFSTVTALHEDYATAEQFIETDYDIRVQKIGNQYRAYKRTSMGWKGNLSNAVIEDIEVTDRYKLWADECAALFGGMDIISIDAIHSIDGKEYIIELNDTATGLAPRHEKEDMNIIRDLVLQRMEELFT